MVIMLLSKVSNTADTPEHMIIAKPYIKNSFMLGLKSIFDTLSFLVMLIISFDTLLLVFIVNISIVKNSAEKGAINIIAYPTPFVWKIHIIISCAYTCL